MRLTSLTNHTADDTGRPFIAHRLHAPIAPCQPNQGFRQRTSGTWLYCQPRGTAHCTRRPGECPTALTVQLPCPGDFGGLRHPAQTNVLTHICFLTSRCPRAGKSDNVCEMGGKRLNPPRWIWRKGTRRAGDVTWLPKSALGR